MLLVLGPVDQSQEHSLNCLPRELSVQKPIQTQKPGRNTSSHGRFTHAFTSHDCLQMLVRLLSTKCVACSCACGSVEPVRRGRKSVRLLVRQCATTITLLPAKITGISQRSSRLAMWLSLTRSHGGMLFTWGLNCHLA